MSIKMLLGSHMGKKLGLIYEAETGKLSFRGELLERFLSQHKEDFLWVKSVQRWDKQ